MRLPSDLLSSYKGCDRAWSMKKITGFKAEEVWVLRVSRRRLWKLI